MVFFIDVLTWHRYQSFDNRQNLVSCSEGTSLRDHIKQLKLRQNSNWPGKCSSQLRLLQQVPRRRSRPLGKGLFCVPGACLLRRRGIYCGARLLRRCQGRKVEWLFPLLLRRPWRSRGGVLQY